ncbi:MAG TPA: TRAP transporter TatT component family protein [Pyrinomonadaceae bacterium]|nr:TRAP transporter TatT component family protein [Pyrinomonadaceae bacterium]
MQPAVDSGDPVTAAARIAEADKLYSERSDLSRVRLGIALLRQAQIADYGNYEAAWKLAKFNYYLGAHTVDDRERETAFREGIDAGTVAIRLNADKPEGHFWLGANYGGDAENSTLAGLANVEDIRREMDAVLKIDPKFEGASAYLALGKLYQEAPRVLGGDNQKAIEYLEKGVRVDGSNAMIRLYLAKAYHATRRDSEARKKIDEIRKMDPNPNYLPEYKEALDEANKLDQQIAAQR